MPQFLPVLSPDDVLKRRSVKVSRVDLTPYLQYLHDIRPGYAGEIELQSGENKPTIKRRVTMAASRLGKQVKYLRSGENRLLFEIISEEKG